MQHDQTRIAEIPYGDAGIYETVAYMRRLARTPSLAVSRLATAWTLGARSQREQVERLHSALVQAFRFVDDPVAETLYAPDLSARRVAETGTFFGDCDDLAMMVAALGLSLGIPASYVIIAECSGPECDGVTPFSHVYSLLYPSLTRPVTQSIDTVDFDLTRPEVPPPVSRVVVFHV